MKKFPQKRSQLYFIQKKTGNKLPEEYKLNHCKRLRIYKKKKQHIANF
jgi:hypothetical protein